MSNIELPEIVGYSERGMIWSFFSDLLCENKWEIGVNAILNKIYIPNDADRFRKNKKNVHYKVMIEQSFSGFGDADAVIIATINDHHHRIFIEGKVCAQGNWKSKLNSYRDKFNIHKPRFYFSNIYHQLLAKQRLMANIDLSLSNIPLFDNYNKNMSIGENKVVLNAVKYLKLTHKNKTIIPTYVALIPSTENFFDPLERDDKQLDWHNIGVIEWRWMEEICEDLGLSRTKSLFHYNEGQIYQ